MLKYFLIGYVIVPSGYARSKSISHAPACYDDSRALVTTEMVRSVRSVLSIVEVSLAVTCLFCYHNEVDA